mgnify:CR=1 FL=1
MHRVVGNDEKLFSEQFAGNNANMESSSSYCYF